MWSQTDALDGAQSTSGGQRPCSHIKHTSAFSEERVDALRILVYTIYLGCHSSFGRMATIATAVQ